MRLNAQTLLYRNAVPIQEERRDKTKDINKNGKTFEKKHNLCYYSHINQIYIELLHFLLRH